VTTHYLRRSAVVSLNKQSRLTAANPPQYRLESASPKCMRP
jgi:hypothetical protein